MQKFHASEKQKRKGIPHTQEWKDKARLRMLGNKHSLGKSHAVTDETKEKIRQSKMGEKNPSWKGDKVGLYGLHRWVERRLPRPDKCSDCGKVGKVDLANISQKYKRDLDDWEYICRSCHVKKDGRVKTNLFYTRRNEYKILPQ